MLVAQGHLPVEIQQVFCGKGPEAHASLQTHLGLGLADVQKLFGNLCADAHDFQFLQTVLQELEQLGSLEGYGILASGVQVGLQGLEKFRYAIEDFLQRHKSGIVCLEQGRKGLSVYEDF